MTTRLQWRDVSAPNYTNAIQGLSLFGQQFGNGMSGLSDALAGFQKDRSQAAEQQVMRAAQAYPDPAEYQRALASGQLYRDAGINPEFLTREALNDLNNQATTMIDRATKQQSLTADQFKHGQLVKTTEALEASRPAVAKLISEATGLDFSSEGLGQLPAAQLVKLAENTNALKSTTLDNDVTKASLDTTTQNRADAEELARFNNAFPDAAFDRNSATAFFKNYKFPNERVRQAAAASLDKYYGSGVVNLDASTAGTGAGTGTAGTTTAAPAPVTSITGTPTTSSRKGYNTVVGGGQENLISTPIGDWEDKIAPRLIEVTRNTPIMEKEQAGKGSSGSGRYQITRDTLREIGPTVLGKDYRKLPFNETNQEKVGDALYTRRNQNNTPMTNEWRGLRRIRGAEDPGAWKDIPWDVARDVIAQYETGDTAVLGPNATMDDVKAYARTRATGTAGASSVVPTAAQRTSTQLTQGALRDRMLAAQLEYGSPATERIQQIVSDPARRSADFNTVATGLVEQFKGIDDTISKSDITTYLRRVMQKGKINFPAVAAEFIKDSAEGTMFGGRTLFGETSVDDATLEATIETWKKGGFEQGSDYLRQLDVVGKGLTTAQAAYDQAASRYRRLELAIQNGRPDMASGLPALEQEVRKAESQLAAAQIAAESIKAPTRERVPLRQGTPTQGTARTQGNEKKLPSWGSVFHLSR